MPPKKRNLSVVPPTPVAVAPKKNHFMFVLDKSSSMQSLVTSTVKAFNENVQAIRDASKAFGQETTVGLVTFADHVGVDFQSQPVERLQELTTYSYRPYGNTALIDAVGHAINMFEASPDARNPDASFVILALTDGEENASVNYTEGGRFRGYPQQSLRALMERVQATDRYTIAFLVPRGKGNALARQFGVPRDNIREWDQTEVGVREYAAANSAAVMNFFDSRDMGMTRSKSFYSTDLSTLQKSDLSKLDDLSASFKAMTVDKEADIKTFIESHGKTFVKGAAYYMLTKKELLRNGRNVLVQEKGSRKVYGGDQARKLLGIPAGEVTVTPGNHSNYDVYFQSASINRKLVRGTKLLYDVTKIVDDKETWDSAGAKAAADAKKAAQAAQQSNT